MSRYLYHPILCIRILMISFEQAQLHSTVREKVAIVPVTTCDGLDRLSEARREEIGQLKDEVAILADEACDLDAKPSP